MAQTARMGHVYGPSNELLCRRLIQSARLHHRSTKEKKMILKAFSIRDAKSEIFHPPFFKTTHGEAERDFRTTANDPKTMICQHPEDFDLYFIGVYDDQTGRFDSQPTPQHLLKSIQCVNTEKLGKVRVPEMDQ